MRGGGVTVAWAPYKCHDGVRFPAAPQTGSSVVERRLDKPKIAGSRPAPSTEEWPSLVDGIRSEPGRSARAREFESRLLLQGEVPEWQGAPLEAACG